MDQANKKKILIISMKAGFGHIRAGDALLDYAKINLPDLQVSHVDILDIDPYLTPFSKFYDIVVKKIPIVWQLIYFLAGYKIFYIIPKFLNIFNFAHKHKIRNYIKKENPDIILFTNVVPLPVFLAACKDLVIDKKIGVIVTDYHGNYYYVFDRVNNYFVVNGAVKNDLVKYGVAPEKIIVSGIPVSPKFYVKEDILELKNKYKIDLSLPTILLIASFKMSKNKIISLVKSILNYEPKVNLIFMANGNESLHNLIFDIFKNNKRFHSTSWTDQMHEYMKISDLVISKAGGLTTSECLALQKPIIVVNPIPGQEEYNAKFIVQNSFGVRAKDVSQIVNAFPEMIAKSKKNQVNLAIQKNSCQEIFNVIK